MTPCDEWAGNLNNRGYGVIYVGGKQMLAHRMIWMQDHGHLDRWTFVCHKCDNPHCIRIEHLFAGTPADNMRDKSAKGRHANQQKTHCPHGHAYTPENTKVIASGSRWCRECGRIRTAAYKRRLKETAQ